MAIELADIQIEVLKEINDKTFNPITCGAEEFGALWTLQDLGLAEQQVEAGLGRIVGLTDTGREQVEE